MNAVVHFKTVASVGFLSASVALLSAARALANCDLGIGDDQTYKRPNSWGALPPSRAIASQPVDSLLTDGLDPASRPGMSIAWRNANQVEEVEVRIRNLGTDACAGRVFVDVLDENGGQLLRLEPPDDQKVVMVPAVDQGGREGKILRMKANWALNTLIDEYDSVRRRYDVKATVQPVDVVDSNLFDNSKVKSWNIPFGVQPGQTHVFNYAYKNTTDKPVTVRWKFEHTPYPEGWVIDGIPQSSDQFVLQSGEMVRGTLSMKAPDSISEGTFLESRLSLIKVSDGSMFQQHEWFQVYDTIPPVISTYKLVLTADHRVAIQALVSDQYSGVLEASGVKTEWSTDGGHTWSVKLHNYNRGNFVTPTYFEAVLGPFAPHTPLLIRFSATDTAGNVQSVIPPQAIGLSVPPQYRSLFLTQAIFPRNKPNPVFEMPLNSLKTFDLKRVQGPADGIVKMSTLQVTTL